MPWIGVAENGERVIPEEMADGERVNCPSCGKDMYPRGPTADGKARHFVHNHEKYTTCTGGGVGESDVHRLWKSMVLSSVRQWFPGDITESAPEVTIDTKRTGSPVEMRRADVFTEFDPPHPVFGEVLVVEVQHKNTAKDRESVNHDYVTLGYSVYWTDEADFSDRFDIHRMIEAFQRDDDGRGDAIVGSETDPREFDPISEAIEDDAGEALRSSTNSVGDSTDNQNQIDQPTFEKVYSNVPVVDSDGHFVPHIPDCSHDFPWAFEGSSNICKKCGIQVHQIRNIRETDSYIARTRSEISKGYMKNVDNVDLQDEEVIATIADEGQLPRCGDRVWRIDDDDNTYVCVWCGKRFSQDADVLRGQVGPAE